MTHTHLVCFAALLVTPACFIAPPAETDAPRTTPTDPATPAEQELSATSYAVTSAVGHSLTTLSAMFAPMEQTGDGFCDQSDGEGQCRSEAGDNQMESNMANAMESGYANGETCTQVELIDLAWTRIAVKATFDQCELESGGAVDGAITLGGELNPVHLWVEFEDFTLDTSWADGTADISFQQDGPSAVETVIAMDLALSLDNGAVTLDLDQTEVVAGQAGATMNGGLDVSSPTFAADVTASALHWNRGECLPSSGAIDFQDGSQNVEASFLPSTPADGKVLVSLNGGPQFLVEVFAPCAPTQGDAG